MISSITALATLLVGASQAMRLENEIENGNAEEVSILDNEEIYTDEGRRRRRNSTASIMLQPPRQASQN